MTLLSSPQGTPERVWSLVAGLSALGGASARATYDALLNPGFGRDGVEVKAKATLAADAHNAALSLALVEGARDQINLVATLPDSFAGFADLVHDRLIGLASGDGDAVILEGYAWVVVESDRQNGMQWIYQAGREEFAELANSGLTGKEMNSTKAVAWRRWLAFLGLGVPMPTERSAPDFPSPAMRILRELERAEIVAGSTLPAAEFIALVARRMPYLDRGRLFTQACQRIGHAAPANRLSPLLSAALRDLHDDQSLRLVPSGDAADRVRLSEDASHAIDAFTTVVVFPGSAS
ncbi:hypothetical protein SAMN03159338_2817 [Sphingomonas sp. NFR04]|uniref:hypothetical protein n=1 Tax=Sphingomonas sp. NFR04 TaxID=1566283 RepID=UPI0008EBFEBB|nr:hypothetical protein [Sphingomonas sp. NFR04]SFJ97680.1 hypothetical protein SAMN03159338_2817 [Sphingomonas sp. NFR04]